MAAAQIAFPGPMRVDQQQDELKGREGAGAELGEPALFKLFVLDGIFAGQEEALGMVVDFVVVGRAGQRSFAFLVRERKQERRSAKRKKRCK